MFMTWGNFILRKMIWFYYKQRLLTVQICNGSHSQHTKTCMHCMVINYMFIENRSREKKACIWYIHLKSSALTFHGAFSLRVSCCLLYQLYVNVQLRILFFFLHFVHQYNVYFFHMFENIFYLANLDTSI